MTLFQERCATCHMATPPPDNRAPSLTELRNLSPEAILVAITTGPMAPNATDLTEPQRRAIAEYLGGRAIGASETSAASAMTNQCRPGAIGDIAKMPRWNGWGADVENSRFQPREGGGAQEGRRTQAEAEMGVCIPNATSMYSQPAIAGGRLFVGSDNAVVYALNAETGCVYWSFQAGRPSAPQSASGRSRANRAPRYAIYFGDLNGAVYAVNAETGTLLWKQQADPHPLARITGAPTLHRGRLYVPVTALEEGVASNPKYECCTSQGAVVAYDANTGAQLWRASTISAPLARTTKTSVGTQLWGPAGAGVWSAPTVDERTNSLYVATGNGFTTPAAPTSDAIIAFDLDTGRMRWAKQLTPDDAYIFGCDRAETIRDVSNPHGP